MNRAVGLTDHEIEAMIASKVMGWKVENGLVVINGAKRRFHPLSDMNDACKIVERFDHYEIYLNQQSQMHKCTLLKWSYTNPEGTVEAETPAKAICLAALKVIVGVDFS